MSPTIRGNRGVLADIQDLKLRDAADGSPFFRFSGLAAVFNRHSEPLYDYRGQFIEQIHPGAFGAALRKNPDVVLNIDHDDSRVLARTTAGTLELSETDEGLRAWASIPNKLSDAKDLKVRMEHGLVQKMSFAFNVGQESDDGETDTGMPLRGIREVSNLFDVSVCVRPAYGDTTAALRMWIPPGAETRRDYTQAEREAFAKKGWALPDGSFPIADTQDLKNAVEDIGRASDPAAAKAHIKKRAEALGATNLLPEDWRTAMLGDVETRQEADPAVPERPSETATPEASDESALADLKARERRLRLVQSRADATVRRLTILL